MSDLLERPPAPASTGGRPSINITIEDPDPSVREFYGTELTRIASDALAEFDAYTEIRKVVTDTHGGVCITLNDEIDSTDHPVFGFILNKIVHEVKP